MLLSALLVLAPTVKSPAFKKTLFALVKLITGWALAMLTGWVLEAASKWVVAAPEALITQSPAPLELKVAPLTRVHGPLSTL